MVSKTNNNPLTEKAMLVYLHCKMWFGRTKDKRVISDVCNRYKADKDAGAWWTYMVPKKCIDPIDAARMHCRHVHFKHTLPWLDGGLRMLAAKKFNDYRTEMNEAIGEYDNKVAYFLKHDLPEAVRTYKARLGSLADNKRLPSAAELKSHFSIKIRTFPVPDVKDMRVKLAREDLDDVTTSTAQSIAEAVDSAMLDLWGQLAERVERLVNVLKNSKRKPSSRSFQSLKDFCDLIPDLNFTEDSHLTEIRKEVLDKLVNLDADKIKDSKKSRRKAVQTGNELLEKMKDYAGL